MKTHSKDSNFEERIEELEALNDKLRTVLGNLVRRIYCESMIPGGTLSRWRKELDPAAEVLKESGWYEGEK